VVRQQAVLRRVWTQYVDIWDGADNKIFWKQDGCGPSAVVVDAKGEFLVTCYDSNSIGRISADGDARPLCERQQWRAIHWPE